MTDLATALGGPAKDMAPRLLGCELVRQIDGRTVAGRIVETEAYDQSDAASHSYRGQTPRTEIMFGPAGCLYVYFSYGMHYCCNVVTGQAGEGSAVLIRALEPIEGEDIMSLNRRRHDGLANGPAKLCQALNINKSLNGHDLAQEPLQLILKPPLPQASIAQATRIGIREARHQPWRFYIKGSAFVSKP